MEQATWDQEGQEIVQGLTVNNDSSQFPQPGFC